MLEHRLPMATDRRRARGAETKKAALPKERGFLGMRNVRRSVLTDDVDLSADELNDAGLQGEEGVILADADVVAGQEVRAALTDDDGAGRDAFAGVAFHAATLSVAVAAVAGRPAAFLMSHD
jgi:hypothetical protein